MKHNPSHDAECHPVLVAKHFPSDFYVTCATVIPVLFLAVAVQGRTYESVLQAARRALPNSSASERARRPWRWLRQLWGIVKSWVLQIIACAVVVAGGYGEVEALLALYRGSEAPGQRWAVLLTTLILVDGSCRWPVPGLHEPPKTAQKVGVSHWICPQRGWGWGSDPAAGTC
jgi:hypothetical protein